MNSKSLVFICLENHRSDHPGFYVLSPIPDFADVLDIRQRSVLDFLDYELFICYRGIGAQQFTAMSFASSNHLITMLSAKFGWKSLFFVGHLVTKLATVVSNQFNERLVAAAIGELGRSTSLVRSAVTPHLTGKTKSTTIISIL